MMPDIAASWKLGLTLTLLLAQAAPVDAQPKDEWGDPLPAGALLRMGTTRFRHPGQIYALAYSVDGRYLVTGNAGFGTFIDDSSVILWNAQTGQELRRWPGHAHYIRSVDISPDNKRIAVANTSGKLVIHHVDTDKEPWRFETDFAERALFSNDGDILFVTDRATLRRFDMKTGKELAATRDHTDRIFDLAVAAAGNLIATCSSDRTVHVYEIDGVRAPVRRHTFMIPDQYGIGLAFSPDGKRLACGTGEPGLYLWDVTSFRELWRLKKDPFRLSARAFAPDGKSLVSGGHDNVKILDAANGKTIHEIKGLHYVNSFSMFAPDGKQIAVAGNHAVIRFWDSVTRNEIVHGEGHARAVSGGAFTLDGKTFATASGERLVRLWDVQTGKVRRCAENLHAHSLTMAPDGQRLVTSGFDARPSIWDLAGGRALGQFAPKNKEDAAGGLVAFSADGKTFASGDGGLGVRVWDVATRQEMPCSFRGEVSDLMALDFPRPGMPFVLAPDGKTFAAARRPRVDEEVILWDIAADKERRKLAARGQPGAFTPDGRLIAIFHERDVSLVETATGFEMGRIPSDNKRVINAAFAPDGKSLAIVGSSTAVTVWEVATLRQRRVFNGHRAGVRVVAFAPDGRQLASGSDDLTALLWDLTGAAAKRALTPKECETLWTALSGADGTEAYQAIWTLAANPDESIPYLQARLKPIAPPDPKRMARLIAELDSASYAVRQNATKELEALGELAVPTLGALAPGNGTLEFRRRVEELLQRTHFAAPPPEQLRQLRALEALEHARTPAARCVLEGLAKGMPEARLTQDAIAAVARLALSGVPSVARRVTDIRLMRLDTPLPR